MATQHINRATYPPIYNGLQRSPPTDLPGSTMTSTVPTAATGAHEQDSRSMYGGHGPSALQQQQHQHQQNVYASYGHFQPPPPSASLNHYAPHPLQAVTSPPPSLMMPSPSPSAAVFQHQQQQFHHQHQHQHQHQHHPHQHQRQQQHHQQHQHHHHQHQQRQPLSLPHSSPASPEGQNQQLDQKPQLMSMTPPNEPMPTTMASPDHTNRSDGGGSQASPSAQALAAGGKTGASPGPIPATTPVVRQDNNGTQWISFEYSRDRVKVKYVIRCDVENVNVDILSPEFRMENCVYPRAYCNREEYKGNRLAYETDCNIVGWALAHLNETLRGKRGLIQRAVDSWRNSNQDVRLRSRRVRRLAKVGTRKSSSSSNTSTVSSASSSTPSLLSPPRPRSHPHPHPNPASPPGYPPHQAHMASDPSHLSMDQHPVGALGGGGGAGRPMPTAQVPSSVMPLLHHSHHHHGADLYQRDSHSNGLVSSIF